MSSATIRQKTSSGLFLRDPQRLNALCALWQSAEQEVWITLQGESMVPTILPGSRLRLQCSTEQPQIGQIIAFRRENSLIVHRLREITQADNTGETLFICKGDGNSFCDSPISHTEIVGRILETVPPTLLARQLLALRWQYRRVRHGIQTWVGLIRRGKAD